MKNLLLVLFVSTMLCACSKDDTETITPDAEKFTISVAERISVLDKEINSNKSAVKTSTDASSKLAAKSMAVYKKSESGELSLLWQIKKNRYYTGEENKDVDQIFQMELEEGNYVIRIIGYPHASDVVENKCLKNMKYYTWANLELETLDSNLKSIGELFYGEVEVEVTDEDQQIEVDLERLVGRVDLNSTAQLPDNAEYMVVKIGSNSKYSYSNKQASNPRVMNFKISKERYNSKRTDVFFRWCFLPTEETDVVVELRDAEDQILHTKTIENIAITKNRTTVIKGNFWTTTKGISININDFQWIDPEIVNI